jgi:hypothetical protein
MAEYTETQFLELVMSEDYGGAIDLARTMLPGELERFNDQLYKARLIVMGEINQQYLEGRRRE